MEHRGHLSLTQLQRVLSRRVRGGLPTLHSTLRTGCPVLLNVLGLAGAVPSPSASVGVVPAGWPLWVEGSRVHGRARWRGTRRRGTYTAVHLDTAA